MKRRSGAGRLFWKFLFAFWLTLLAAGLSVGVLVWLHQRAQSHDNFVEEGGRAAFMVKTGVGLFNSGGPASLLAAMKGWEQEGPVLLYVVDSRGTELLGRTPEPAAVTEAAQLANTADPNRAARWVVAHNGDRYLLYVPAGMFGPPHGPPRDGNGPADRGPGPGGPDGPGPDGPPGPPGPRGPPPPWPLIAAGLIASLFFSALLAWYVAQPIRHLRRAFDAAAKGELDVRVKPLIGRRRDEIADLGMDFDRMAERLQDLIGAQRRLFHDVSHELRSPLARIQAAVSLARQRPEKSAATLDRVERETLRLDQLVGELLLLARLESGVPGELEEEIDLYGLMAGIVEDAQVEAEAAGCHVAMKGSAHALLTGRAELLARALENVVRNAVKHSARDGHVQVELTLEPSHGEVLLVVSDEGPGVPERDLPMIFDPFFRGQHAQHPDGHGLGLAIARRAIEAHGGRITARNRRGGGLRVEIHLPLR